jgi:hypothetical protein
LPLRYVRRVAIMLIPTGNTDMPFVEIADGLAEELRCTEQLNEFVKLSIILEELKLFGVLPK